MPQMRQSFTRRQPQNAVVNGAAEQYAKAIDRAPRRFGKQRMEAVETGHMTLLQPVEPRVQSVERLTMRRQDKKIIGQRAEFFDGGEPISQRIALGLWRERRTK